MMSKAQAKGYFLEGMIHSWFEQSGFIEVKEGSIHGRTTDHQIDVYGDSPITIPFTYPLRILIEAKWNSPGKDEDKTTGLEIIRDFLGKVIDIDQNFFVPLEMRKPNTGVPKERYLFHGCVISTLPFSYRAQHFAWGHGIVLIPLSSYELLRNLLNEAEKYIENIFDKKLMTIDCKNLQSEGRKYAADHSNLFYYSGLLNKEYYILIVSDKMLPFEKTDFDRNSADFDKTSAAIKIERIDDEGESEFKFQFINCVFEFCLPNFLAKKIISRIDDSNENDLIATLDIPYVFRSNDGIIRRIFQIDLKMPTSIKNKYSDENRMVSQKLFELIKDIRKGPRIFKRKAIIQLSDIISIDYNFKSDNEMIRKELFKILRSYKRYTSRDDEELVHIILSAFRNVMTDIKKTNIEKSTIWRRKCINYCNYLLKKAIPVEMKTKCISVMIINLDRQSQIKTLFKIFDKLDEIEENLPMLSEISTILRYFSSESNQWRDSIRPLARKRVETYQQGYKLEILKSLSGYYDDVHP